MSEDTMGDASGREFKKKHSPKVAPEMTASRLPSMPSALKSPKKKSPIPVKATTTEAIFAGEGNRAELRAIDTR